MPTSVNNGGVTYEFGGGTAAILYLTDNAGAKAKPHSMTHDLTAMKAAQYLVFASLLARRIDEAR